jgi:hypothetical protein
MLRVRTPARSDAFADCRFGIAIQSLSSIYAATPSDDAANSRNSCLATTTAWTHEWNPGNVRSIGELFTEPGD